MGPSGSLWAHRDFRRLWAAQAVSAVGSRVSRTAMPVVAISLLNASATSVSILSALAMAPGVVIALFAGGLIDRARKRPLLIAMDIVRAVLLLTLPAAAIFDVLTMTQLVVVATLTGAATAVFVIAESAYLPRLIGAGQLVDGNTKLQTSEAVAEIAGPSLAGILIHAVTAPVAIFVDALSFVWSAWWMRQIESGEDTAPSVAAEHHPLSDIFEGWRACRQNPFVLPLLLAQGIFGLFGGFFAAIYMIYALRTLELDVATVGIVIGVGGLGALWGAVAAMPLSRALGVGRAVVLSLTCWVIATTLIPAAEGRGDLAVPFLVAQQLIGDGFLTAFLILAVSIRQTALHEDVQARAGATFQLVEGLTLPTGALIAGPLADAVGTGGVLWIAIAGACVPLLILALSRLWTLQTLEDARILA
ncbi:MAG: MFS transporter [Alphaproteobacteria bacterium]|nr:MFS transporter [Alphaproteobacteria bacterium]